MAQRPLTLNDFTWLAADAFFYYNKLKDSLQFWEEARRAPEGLYLWARGLESGVDNTPAIFNFTAGVDLQCYLYREYRAMATIALQLGNRLQEGPRDRQGLGTLRARRRGDVQQF